MAAVGGAGGDSVDSSGDRDQLRLLGLLVGTQGVAGVSQVALNYLATASDFGKALGWSSGLAILYL
ncbi:hypothetical protein E2562_033853 [Oryza meyeriana var. granulata]|uniref:Nodulin-like domain-containing protein n=1 Tax=Oryza meyeriana var. granulata TaxID=110450 RepID=A0A6G1BPW3_9ORYZ|nr:hypothetical protein E2562_033853 [Oryza meyeriana var. granulata]